MADAVATAVEVEEQPQPIADDGAKLAEIEAGYKKDVAGLNRKISELTDAMKLKDEESLTAAEKWQKQVDTFMQSAQVATKRSEITAKVAERQLPLKYVDAAMALEDADAFLDQLVEDFGTLKTEGEKEGTEKTKEALYKDADRKPAKGGDGEESDDVFYARYGREYPTADKDAKEKLNTERNRRLEQLKQ